MPCFAVSARVTRIELHTVSAASEDTAKEAARRKILAHDAAGVVCEVVSIRPLDYPGVGGVEC